MSDAQLAALLTAAGVVFTGFGKLAWSMFGAWLKEREADRVERKADRDADRTERREDRAAQLETAREMTAAIVRVSERVSSLERVFDRNDSRISGVHDVQPEPEPAAEPERPRVRTQPGGVPRAITERPFDPRRER